MSEAASNTVGPLTIVVCIKQVPLLSALRFDQQTRRLIREGVPLEINELDVYALSEAIRLRDLHGGEVIAITMGPPQAREALATALAMGVDNALHLNDRTFAGADTAATAYALARAIQYLTATHQKNIDLIFCGRHSIDAETAQVGPEIAEMLDLPQISAIQKIELQLHNATRQLCATRELDEGSETLIVPLPALVTAAERLNEGIWPDEHAIRAASEQAGKRIQVVTAADLHIDSTQAGQQGSPTWVEDVVADTYERQGHIIAESDPEKSVEQLIEELARRGLLSSQTTLTRAMDDSAPSAWPRRQGNPLPGRAVWIVAERSPQGIRPITYELLGKGNNLAASLQGELAALLIGGSHQADTIASLAAYGAERVYTLEHPALEQYTTEGYTAAVTQAITLYQPAVVLIGATANGRDLAPRVAARLKLGLTGDCIDLAIDEQQRLVQYKPAFGGSIISSILSQTTPAMATLRPGMLQAARPDYNNHPLITPIHIEDVEKLIRTQVVSSSVHTMGATELDSATTILGVGMGMGEPERYEPLYQLTAQLDAAIGATRNVTDRGWLPKYQQIGLTGRAVAPRLYIALGIRGAAEHIAGIRKAGFVVSINKNKRAAIFKHSDIGIVGDVHVLLPLLVQKLQERQLAQ